MTNSDKEIEKRLWEFVKFFQEVFGRTKTIQFFVERMEKNEEITGKPDIDLPVFKEMLSISKKIDRLLEKYSNTSPIEVDKELRDKTGYLDPNEAFFKELGEITTRAKKLPKRLPSQEKQGRGY